MPQLKWQTAARGRAPRHSAHCARVGQRPHATRRTCRRGATPFPGTDPGGHGPRRRPRRGRAAVSGTGPAARLARSLTNLTKPPLLAQRDAGGVAAGVLPPELVEHLADVDGDAPE